MNIKYLILIIIIVMVGGMFGYYIYNSNQFVYSLKGSDGLYEQIIKDRNYGIEMAKAKGEYKCCIEPACTMCYMEGNKWNNGQAGTCACDEFIARGKEPCPQCAKALSCGSKQEDELVGEESTKCEVNTD